MPEPMAKALGWPQQNLGFKERLGAVTSPEGSCGEEREIFVQPLGKGPGGRPEFGVPSGRAAEIALPAGDPGA